MLNTKFLDIIKSLTKDELRQFREYIRSPFHNTNKNVTRLFEIIRKYGPGYESASIEKENLFGKIYPGKKYNDTVMRILLSDLLKSAEEFLVLLNLEKDKPAQELMLLEELKNRNLGPLFNGHVKETEKLLENEGITLDSYFLNRYRLESLKVDRFIASDSQAESSGNLLKKSEMIVCFALVNLLNIVQELSEHTEVYNEKFEFELAREVLKNTDLNKIMDFMKRHDFRYYPVIEIYYLLYKCMLKENYHENYKRLKQLIEENLLSFDRHERYNLYLILESCCVGEIRHGTPGEFGDLFSVYDSMLKHEIFSAANKDVIQANLYRNIFYTAIMTGNFEWAGKFSREYSEFLLPEVRTDMTHYTNSILFFERGDFEKALENISKVNYSFFVFRYEAKVQMLKIYYELRSFEPALSLIDSFAHFLTKNKSVSDIYREQFMNFLKYIRILIRYLLTGKKLSAEDLRELENAILNTKLVINRKWLLKKAAEFVKG